MDLRWLDHSDAAVARQMRTLLSQTHAQEAAWLHMANEAAPEVAEIQASPCAWLGAVALDGPTTPPTLLGLMALVEDDAGQQLIHRLVVLPKAQRRGIARALVQRALQTTRTPTLAVVAAEGNRAALALYTGLGFVPCRRGRMGPAGLAVVKLQRSATPS